MGLARMLFTQGSHMNMIKFSAFTQPNFERLWAQPRLDKLTNYYEYLHLAEIGINLPFAN